jgi:beta-lactamase regulating signal transducer with metallopeptidase domain/uncharacterized protein involved in exopolysaccharide biosynthesis
MNAPLAHIVQSAFAWICHTSLSAAVLIAFVLAIQFAFGKYLSPRWRYALGLLVLLRFLLPFAPASSFSVFNLASHSAQPAPVPAAPEYISTQLPSLPLPAVSSAPAVPELFSPKPAIIPIASVTHAAISTPPARITIRGLAPWIWLAGFVALLLTVAGQYHLFVRKLGRWELVAEPRVLELLQGCRTTLGLRRPVILLAATGLDTPALFGLLRPRLLIPADMLRRLDDRELRHILLHELTHLQRGDLLVNWALILVRAAHWFNPLVWLAFRRLRADQELACDAAVIARLAHDERRSYGHTLLKLLDQFSSHGLCPGLVPFITNKQIIKRRIVMISNFQPAGRFAACAALALLLTLGVFTFTRAAEQKPAAAPPLGHLSIVVINDDGSIHLVMKDAPAITLDQLKQQLKLDKSKDSQLTLELDVAKKANYQVVSDVLKIAEELHIHEVGFGVENTVADTSNFSQRVEDEVKSTILNQNLAQAGQKALELRVALASVTNLSGEPLAEELARIHSTPVLIELLQNRDTAEQELTWKRATLGDNHPDVVATSNLISALNSQIKQTAASELYALRLELAQQEADVQKLGEQLQKPDAVALPIGQPSPPATTPRQILENQQPNYQVPHDVLDEYERDFALLERTTDDYNVALVKYPAGSAPLKDSKNLVDHYKARIDQLEKQYPDLVAATRPDMERTQNIQNLDRTISVLQSKLRDMRDRHLTDVSDGADPTPYIAHVNETIAETQTQLAKNSALLDQLNSLGQADLRQVLSTTVPDSILTQLLQDQLSAESKLAQMTAIEGPGNDDVKSQNELIKKLDDQIRDRVKGIITGLRAQVDVEASTIKSLKNQVQIRSQEQADLSDANASIAALEKQLANLRAERDQLSRQLSSAGSAYRDPWGNDYIITLDPPNGSPVTLYPTDKPNTFYTTNEPPK